MRKELVYMKIEDSEYFDIRKRDETKEASEGQEKSLSLVFSLQRTYRNRLSVSL